VVIDNNNVNPKTEKNSLLNNESIKNKKNFKNMLDTLKANKKSSFNKIEGDKAEQLFEGTNSTNNTPQRTLLTRRLHKISQLEITLIHRRKTFTSPCLILIK
jgi:hypothetical protein